jgi:lysozyme family protein
LAGEYEQLFANCRIRPERVPAIDTIAARSVANMARYEAVGVQVGTPWYVIAAIHNLESGQRFTTHLHNGDPLTARTTHVPAGRPLTGAPPFSWEASASDALKLQGFHTVGTWTLPVMLFRFERYNGFGYRKHHPEVLSPYLWSFTTAYTKGKFVADGKFSATAVSQQCGAVALLLRLAARNDIDLPAGSPPQDAGPTMATGPPFPGVALKRGDRGANVCAVQQRLRQLGFQIAQVAGCPYGPQTEAAVMAFQRQKGLRDSGRVGRDTWKALFG